MNTADRTRLRLELVEERGYSCENCGRTGGELHHCFFHGRKPDIFEKENLMIACRVCHVEKKLLDSNEAKQRFWLIQCERYGTAHMDDWLMTTHLNHFKTVIFKPD